MYRVIKVTWTRLFAVQHETPDHGEVRVVLGKCERQIQVRSKPSFDQEGPFLHTSEVRAFYITVGMTFLDVEYSHVVV